MSEEKKKRLKYKKNTQSSEKQTRAQTTRNTFMFYFKTGNLVRNMEN